MCVCAQSCLSLRLYGARQAPLSTGFSRQEYWRELPCIPPGELPNSGMEPASLVPPALTGRFFTPAPPRKPLSLYMYVHVSIPICFRVLQRNSSVLFSLEMPN